MTRASLLGVPLDPLTREQAVEQLFQLLQGEGQHHVATPNNEMLVEAQRNSPFKDVLNRTDLNLPDSSGLLLMARLTGQALPEQVTGVDTVSALCAQLDSSVPVYLLGAGDGIAEQAADVLRAKNRALEVVGTYGGSPSDTDAQEIIERINQAKPSLLLVAFGAPAQDLWIARHLKQMPSVKVAMGVGGTFDFLSGRIARAPSTLRALHLEWLWRLILQPWRIGRIWKAVVIFPLLVLTRNPKSQNPNPK